jgi:predicted alpha-1,6-mannanase (GH76 family)
LKHERAVASPKPIAWRFVSRLTLGIAMAAVLCLSSAASENEVADSSNQRAALAIHALQSWYDQQTGLYQTTGWWNAANAITTLADFEKAAHSHEFDPIFSNTFTAAQKTSAGFINKFYDDEGWWALAWIDVYDLTRDPRYLAMSKSIFTDMSGAWDETCSGGIWWSKDRNYKNAIANELYLSVAAHLAVRTRGHERKEYLTWASREWRWFSASGMVNADHLINDGLDAKCVNNQKTTWTYNQGVILGAVAELSHASHDHSLLPAAQAIAKASLASKILVDANGILHEPCEPDCGGDGSQFKGIFARNLCALAKISPQPEYAGYLRTNAVSIWKGAHAPDYHLGVIWAAPYGMANASTQSSAADLLVCAMTK